MPGLAWMDVNQVARNLPVTLTPQRHAEYDHAIERAMTRFGAPLGRRRR